MNKQFILPFRLGKKQNRAVLDSLGHEVVVFPKGCEYLASDYIKLMNDSLPLYRNGRVECPYCGIVSIGAIPENKCVMCGNNRFNHE